MVPVSNGLAFSHLRSLTLHLQPSRENSVVGLRMRSGENITDNTVGVGLSSHSRPHAVSQCQISPMMLMTDSVSGDWMMQRVPRLGFTAAILFVCCLLCSCTGDGEGLRRRVSVVRRGPWQHEVVEGVHPEAAIIATFTNQINKNGSVVRIRLKFLLQVYKQHVLTCIEFCLL